ncbi:MAG: DUF4239 domain-containing protein [Beijerinckiaceae bacterium]|nr:DUF4239 domain-containing protein [Beijerinckiaceae bacterium]
MIEAWLNLPTPAMIAAATGFFFGFALFLHWLTFASPARVWVQSFAGVVAPFFSSTAVILALMFSLLSSDVWDRFKRAQLSVAQERNGLHSLVVLSRATDAPEGLRDAVRTYLKAAVDNDWREMAEQEPTLESDAALDPLLRMALVAPRAGANTGASLASAIETVRNARQARLALANQSVDGVRWLTVIVLAMLTQLGMALVHVDKRRAQAAALTVFTAATVIMFTLVALYEYPFSPPFSISSEPLRSLTAQIGSD